MQNIVPPISSYFKFFSFKFRNHSESVFNQLYKGSVICISGTVLSYKNNEVRLVLPEFNYSTGSDKDTQTQDEDNSSIILKDPYNYGGLYNIQNNKFFDNLKAELSSFGLHFCDNIYVLDDLFDIYINLYQNLCYYRF